MWHFPIFVCYSGTLMDPCLGLEVIRGAHTATSENTGSLMQPVSRAIWKLDANRLTDLF